MHITKRNVSTAHTYDHVKIFMHTVFMHKVLSVHISNIYRGGGGDEN